MSETITAPQEESIYPPLSEATENDVREAAPAVEDEATDASVVEEQPQAPETADAAVEATEEPAEDAPAEDDEKARNARLARMLREEKRRARQLELQAQVAAGQRQETRDETMEREIEQRAQQRAYQQQINARANDIYNEGVKAFGRVEFDESVKAVNEAFGATMPIVIDTLTDIEDAQKLIQYLGDNPDIMDDYAALPPHKLGAALARQAAKLSQPKPKPLSKAPAPIQPIRQVSSTEPTRDIEKMSMDELAKLWDKRDFQKRMGM